MEGDTWDCYHPGRECLSCGRLFELVHIADGEAGDCEDADNRALCRSCREDDGYRLTPRGALYQTLPEDHPAVGMKGE